MEVAAAEVAVGVAREAVAAAVVGVGEAVVTEVAARAVEASHRVGRMVVGN